MKSSASDELKQCEFARSVSPTNPSVPPNVRLSANVTSRSPHVAETTGKESGSPNLVFRLVTPPLSTGATNAEESLLNRSSVLFVAVSFILLMVISLAWLIFYYVQRFRYLHSKERASVSVRVLVPVPNVRSHVLQHLRTHIFA